MTSQYDIPPSQHKKNRGIAILFTLGILAILLVLALAFAETARTTYKAAVNNNDVATARLLCESAVQRATGAMRFYSETASGYQYDDVISHDETSVNKQTYDWLYRLGTTVNGATIYAWPSSYSPTPKSAVHWQYIDNGLPNTDADYKLIGRIGYVVIGAGGKLDPSVCVKHGTAPVANEDGDNVDRKGAEIQEICIKNLDQTNATTYMPNAAIPYTINDFNSTNATTAGKLTDGSRWTDWDTMFAPVNFNIPSTVAGDTNKEQFRTWFVLNNPKDSEAFWVDKNSNGLTDPNELFHRFDLARPQTNANYPAPEPYNPGWGQITVADILSDPVVFSTATSHYGKGIKYLKNYSSLPNETFTSAQIRAQQIAANIIDYCKSTNPLTPTTDSAINPVYFGNVKAPYLNEIGIKFEVTSLINPDGGNTYHNSYAVSYYLGAEYINLYDGVATTPVDFEIVEGQIDFTCTNPDGTDLPSSVVNLAGKTFQISAALADKSYLFNWNVTNIPVPDTGIQPTLTPTAKVKDVTVQLKRVKLNYDGLPPHAPPLGGPADFAKPDYSGGFSQQSGDIASASGSGGTSTETGYFCYQVDDPRQNLNDGDWPQAAYSLVSYAAANGTQGTKNSICNPNPGGNKDVELATALDAGSFSLSTAYIRNAPMQSPWELGAIHRGAKWETLNLKKYNTVADVLDGGGIGNYSDGDANILDQVKMTADTEVYGKVNIHAAEIDVLKALLGYIRVGIPMDSTNSNPGNRALGTVLKYDDGNPANQPFDIGGINIFPNPPELAGVISASATKPFKTRAQICKVQELSGGAAAPYKLPSGTLMDNDAKREELIGKFINLTKADASGTVTIIAIAQTIKDVGTLPAAPSGITIYKDLDMDGSMDYAGQPSTSASEITLGANINGDGDATDIVGISEEITGCLLGQYDQYADEITGEQKIMAIVYKDTVTQKWRILRYEYLEE